MLLGHLILKKSQRKNKEKKSSNTYLMSFVLILKEIAQLVILKDLILLSIFAIKLGLLKK